jgi:hypothetical protein
MGLLSKYPILLIFHIWPLFFSFSFLVFGTIDNSTFHQYFSIGEC